MKIQTKAVHAGDRKKAGAHVPVTTPIYTATSYFYDSMEQLDRVFAARKPGYCYARYDNPTNAALEELMCAARRRRGGAGLRLRHGGDPHRDPDARWPTAAAPSWRRTRSTAPPSAC